VSYIIGIDRKYEHPELPTDDFLLCDLDQNSVMVSATPLPLPSSIRQKLAHLLSVSVPIHLKRGVTFGPPPYIQECYPKNCFTADRAIVTSKRQPAGYSKFVGTHSLAFADTPNPPAEPPVFNAFLYSTRQEERELREFLYGQNQKTVKSVNSVSSFDTAKYGTNASHTSRPSFSSGNTLRDLTASLRGPNARKSGMWSGSFGRNERNVNPLEVIDIVLRISHVEFFGILFTKSAILGYVFG
jgi:hypothetical protein